jgi:hypothetical protein
METKIIYIAPAIKLIKLDNSISLALESSPPEGPGETFNNVQSPFKDETGFV